MSGPPEAQLIHTLSKFHCLLHELYLTNHHSSQEHAIYGTSCLLLAFPSPTTCHLSNIRSINLILSLSSSLFAFFFIPMLGPCIGHHSLPQHNPLKKRKKISMLHHHHHGSGSFGRTCLHSYTEPTRFSGLSWHSGDPRQPSSGLSQVRRCLICEADLDQLSHGLASTDLACCVVVVQCEHWPANFMRLPLTTSLRRGRS